MGPPELYNPVYAYAYFWNNKEAMAFIEFIFYVNLRIDSRNTTDVLDRLFKSARGTPAANTFERKSTIIKEPTQFHELERLRTERAANQPVINDKSRDIVRKSAKFSEPIFSQQRYDQEIQRYRAKRNFDPPKVERSLSKTQPLKKDVSRSPITRILAQTTSMSSALGQDQSFTKHKYRGDQSPQIQPAEKKALNMNEFSKKYEAQRVKWERNRNVQPKEVEPSDLGLDDSSFKPAINLKSRKLAKDIEKIENRVKVLNEGRQKKMEYLKKIQDNYTFKPQINPRSQQMVRGKSAARSVSPQPVTQQYWTNDTVTADALKEINTQIAKQENKMYRSSTPVKPKEKSPSPQRQDVILERIQQEREQVLSKTYHTLRESKDLHNFLKTQTKAAAERKATPTRLPEVSVPSSDLEHFLQLEEEALRPELVLNITEINENYNAQHNHLHTLASEPTPVEDRSMISTSSANNVKIVVKPVKGHLQMKVMSQAPPNHHTETQPELSQSVKITPHSQQIEENGVDSVSLLRAVMSHYKPLISQGQQYKASIKK